MFKFDDDFVIFGVYIGVCFGVVEIDQYVFFIFGVVMKVDIGNCWIVIG